MSILTVNTISRSFGPLKAVDGLSFDLVQGKTLAIVGESGCGKTTAARMIAGLIKPDAGTIQCAKPVQMVFQDPNSSLDPLFTVRRTLEEAFYAQPGVSSKERHKRIVDILAATGLESAMLGRFSHEFSGGQRQRIAIARALLADPGILVLDEITSGLDVLVQQQIVALLKSVKQRFGLSYIFISHNLRVVASFADTIIVMHKGRIVESGVAAEVLKNPQKTYTKELVAAALTFRC